MENVSNKTMSFATLCKIWDYQQRLTARTAICKKDRAKKSLTLREKYNKYAQLGKKLRYKNIIFTFIDGAGYLVLPDGKGIWGTTISDFIKAIETEYNVKVKWA